MRTTHQRDQRDSFRCARRIGATKFVEARRLGYDRRSSPPEVARTWPSRSRRPARPPRCRPTTSRVSAPRSAAPGCSRAGPTTTTRSSTGNARRSSSATGSPSARAEELAEPGALPACARCSARACCWSAAGTTRSAPSTTCAATGAPAWRSATAAGRPLPVPLPRLDLRPRRHARPGQAHRGPGGLHASRTSACSPSGCETWQGFVFLCFSEQTPPLRGVHGRLVRAPRRLRPRHAGLRRAARLEYDVGGQLEDRGRELLRVLPLPAASTRCSTSCTPYDLGEDFLRRGPVEGRLDALRRRLRDDVDGRRPPRPPAAATHATTTEARRIYYYILWPNLIV